MLFNQMDNTYNHETILIGPASSLGPPSFFTTEKLGMGLGTKLAIFHAPSIPEYWSTEADISSALCRKKNGRVWFFKPA